MLNYLAKISTRSIKLVNSQQGSDVTRDILIPRPKRKTLIEIARQTSKGGLSAGGLSEISARISNNIFAINTFDIALNVINEQDFTVAALHEDKIISNNAPGRHVYWHRLIYNLTPAKFILFCQPVYAMIMAENRRLPENRFMLEADMAVGGLAVSTENEGEITSSVIEHHSVLIQGYGLLVWGEEAYQIPSRAEIVNRWCEISMIGTQKEIKNA